MSLNNTEIAELENTVRNLVKIRDRTYTGEEEKRLSDILYLTQNALDVIQRLLPKENRFKNL